MSIVTPGVQPASVLLQQGTPPWLEQWSRFAADFRPADLPAEAMDRAKLVLLDSIGVIASGMQEPELRVLLPRLAATQSGSLPVIGGGVSLAPGANAFAHGTAGTMLELDEGNQYARGHPGIHVVPAVLAARPEASGAAVLGALALGYEIGARIGIASKLRVTMHPHGTWGTVGAALAVAALHGADAATMREVLNIASSFGLSTSRRTMLEGATVRNSYAGLSNQLGILAWDLAQSGFVGETDGIGAVYGGIIAEDFRPEEMVEHLGTRWEIARNYFKRHAACRTPTARWTRWRHSRPRRRWMPPRSSGSRSTPTSGPRSSTCRSRATCCPPSSRCPSRWPPVSCMARPPCPPSASRRCTRWRPWRSPPAWRCGRTRR
jgi:2-methylcitrate dehydratase PrpD